MEFLGNKRRAFLLFVLMLLGAGIKGFATDSVLSSGTWYKMSISSTGIYKLTYSDLESMGVDVKNIDPRCIRIYHNGGGVLPKINKAPYPDDLAEIPIFVSGENDGVFNQNDYILFYARGPVVWKYYTKQNYYSHVKNPYTDYTYVFLTVGDEHGKRIQTAETPSAGAAMLVTEFLDHQVIDVDEVNINNMGCTWYFDAFDITTQRNYNFAFQNMITERDVKVKASMASRNASSASFVVSYKNKVLYSKTYGPTSATIYANADTSCFATFSATASPVSVDVKYVRSATSSVGWMDYISMNAWRRLKMSGNVMFFRNPECNDESKVYEYQLQNASNAIRVWDVTNPIEPKLINTSLSSSTLSFKINGDVGNEFVAFDGNDFNTPTYVGKVANQNLHAKKDIDYLIITNPKFQSHAERLKEIHSHIDDLVIDIVQPQYIYNEFSCGALDIAGIRNFIKMLYKNSSDEHRLKYVLLFGDASYDYKNPDVCLIPSYESFKSTVITSSFVTDDFYVCLGDDEGDLEKDNSSSIIDLAIGRMPVNTTDEATDVLDKIEAYLAKNNKVMSNWRNVVTLMCDDESTGFINNCEIIADSISRWGGDVIVDKLYLDAYNQVATASGQRCPEINEALTNRIERGTLVFGYNGHGGEIGLGDERILTIDDINSWQNLPMLPLFMTATCEFSRFDDHTRTSAGEIMFTSKRGGAIAMITTARTTSNSLEILKRTFRNMFVMRNGEYPTMGDIFYKAKQDNKPDTKVFVLFGDPALRLAYPKNNVVLTRINGNAAVANTDTLKALSTVELQGEVRDNFGERMTDFNGEVRVSVYDKENTYRTKGDNGSPIRDFKVRNSLLFNGRAVVDSGKFEIKFLLPKDINYSYGKGLISFYATDYETDANGSYGDIIIGGYDETALPDVDGPVARIFIDDTLFVSGGITNENPVFYAFIKDKNGINTTGAGIGHDIIATITGATNKTYTLNSYYDTPLDANDYGTIVYRFYGLNEGLHHLNFRVWDIYNNSTNVSLDFNVVKSSNMSIENIFNAPNPMSDQTRFCFEHNQKGDIDVTIRIYNISGQLVKTLNDSRYGTSTRIEPIYWDGTSDSGSPLPSGVYIYNVTLTNSNNEKQSGYSKLVIAR